LKKKVTPAAPPAFLEFNDPLFRDRTMTMARLATCDEPVDIPKIEPDERTK
jgi:hypothetical protein